MTVLGYNTMCVKHCYAYMIFEYVAIKLACITMSKFISKFIRANIMKYSMFFVCGTKIVP